MVVCQPRLTFPVSKMAELEELSGRPLYCVLKTAVTFRMEITLKVSHRFARCAVF